MEKGSGSTARMLLENRNKVDSSRPSLQVKTGQRQYCGHVGEARGPGRAMRMDQCFGAPLLCQNHGTKRHVATRNKGVAFEGT